MFAIGDSLLELEQMLNNLSAGIWAAESQQEDNQKNNILHFLVKSMLNKLFIDSVHQIVDILLILHECKQANKLSQ